MKKTNQQTKSVPIINIGGNVTTTKGNNNIGNMTEDNADFSYSEEINYVNYQFNYDEKLVNKELNELKQKCQSLDSINSFTSNPNQLKKSILFLASKHILATKRQETIDSLIATYRKLNKNGQKYDKITVFGNYLDQISPLADFVPVPGVGPGIRVLNQGISFLTDFLKNRIFNKHSAKFEEHLIEDEKALTLLQETFNFLNNSLTEPSQINSVIKSMLKLNQNDFAEHSVFAITNIQKNSQLKESDLDEAIKLLNNHLKDFSKSLQQETLQYTEQLEILFSSPEGAVLQQQIELLLIKLVGKEKVKPVDNNQQILELKEQISQQEKQLVELIDSAKLKLKSSWSKNNTKKKHNLFNQFLTTGFIDSALASIAKDKKIDLTTVANLQNSLKKLQEQLDKLNSEQLENQVVQLDSK